MFSVFYSPATTVEVSATTVEVSAITVEVTATTVEVSAITVEVSTAASVELGIGRLEEDGSGNSTE